MSFAEKKNLIVRNLQEVFGEDELDAILAEKDLKLFWCTAPTGRPDVEYFVPISKIADFLRAGCEVIVLFADLHAFLSSIQISWKILNLRLEYYKYSIKAMLHSIGVSSAKLKFDRATEYQLNNDYTRDACTLSLSIAEHDAKNAGSEVEKHADNLLLTGFLYPGLQALYEKYLNTDAQFGGADQHKIFTMAENYLPQIGYAKKITLMSPMVPGLTGSIMPSSENDSRIDLLDSPDVVKNKFEKIFCEPGNIAENGLLAFVKHVIFGLFQPGEKFKISRDEANGGDLNFSSYEELENCFAELKLVPADLRASVEAYTNRLLDPIRTLFDLPELQCLVSSAYPDLPENEST